MLPDFNRLKVFYYIFNEQSSTEAAKALHITQSGVSQHLKKLEEELQISLFTRVNRRLVPTAAGIKLYEIVKNFMTHLENGVRFLGDSVEKPTGLIRIGAPSEFGAGYLPQVFATFSRLFPDVSFQLELGDPGKLFDMVSKGELDFAYIDLLPIVIQAPGGLTSYRIEPMFQEEFVLACSKKYYLERVAGKDYEDLINLNYISYKKDNSLFRSWFKLHFGIKPSVLNMVLIADSAKAIISAIEEDMGLGIIISHLVSKQIGEGSIVTIIKTTDSLKNTIACVRFKDKRETITETYFQNHLREELNSISDLTVIRFDSSGI